MVHHALYQKQNYSYAGVIEALSGAPFDVKFISLEDIRRDPQDTTVYTDGGSFDLHLDANEIRWYSIEME